MKNSEKRSSLQGIGLGVSIAGIYLLADKSVNVKKASSIMLLTGLAFMGISFLFKDDEEKSNVVGGAGGTPVIPNPQPALSPQQMTQPMVNPTAKFQNIPAVPPAPPAGGGAPPAPSGGGEHHGHHGGWGGFGWGYPVYIGSQYGYNQCLQRNANGTTAIVNCDNLDELANVDLGFDGTRNGNYGNHFLYPRKARA